MTHFDLAIIGSGTGNSIIGPEFDDWRIAVIEESTFGGTCLNVGCIPTKMYVYPADLARGIQDAARLGVDAEVTAVRWPDLRDRIFARVDAISAAGRRYRRDGTNTTLYEAHARFTDPHTLALSSGVSITADRIVLAAGSRAVVPDIVRDSGVACHTSDTVMRIDELPERVLILGGGFVAAEFAHVFSSFGVHTTVVARGERLLRHLDTEIADTFTKVVRERWDVRTRVEPTALTSDGATISMRLDDASVVEADLLLVATGRVPNSDGLDLHNAGVAVHENGLVAVDVHQRTTAEHIWALGDICSPDQLKHVANHEGRVVAHNLAHPGDLVEADHRFVPAAVFTHPQIATVGLSEDDARAAGIRYVAATYDYGGIAYGWAMADTTSIAKVLADPVTGKLLGAHILGEQAATLIQPLIQAMSFGLDARSMAHGQYWIHPALTEVVENALLALEFA